MIASMAPSVFKSGDRITFVGDSITHYGYFHQKIMMYYLTRFPHIDLTFFNAGIAGDTTGGALLRLDSDVLETKPTHAIIMMGINDIRRELYDTGCDKDPEKLKGRAEALDWYRKDTVDLITRLQAKNIETILQTPSCFDQTSTMAHPNLAGVNDVLRGCVEFLNKCAVKYGLKIIDYWAHLTMLNAHIQQTNPAATLISEDRVHPGLVGHQIMTYQFLHTLGEPRYVSRIVVDATLGSYTDETYNCTIHTINATSTNVNFSCTENALPCAIDPDALDALKQVPFTEELNVEFVKIVGLANGNYTLLIDGEILGTYSSIDMSRGINIAMNSQSPQYKQAMQVFQFLTNEYWPMEFRLRDMRMVETGFLNNCPDRHNPVAVREYLYKKLPDVIEFFQFAIRLYLEQGHEQHSMKQKIEELRKKAYALCQPREHHYSICKVF